MAGWRHPSYKTETKQVPFVCSKKSYGCDQLRFVRFAKFGNQKQLEPTPECPDHSGPMVRYASG